MRRTTKDIRHPATLLMLLAMLLAAGCASPLAQLNTAIDAGDTAQAGKVIAEAQDLDINAQDAEGETPLVRAVKKNDTAMVALLLDKGANANTAGSQAQTPLQEAIQAGNMANFNALLAKGADVNKTGAKGHTPLMSACIAGQLPMVRELLKRGVSLTDAKAFHATYFAIINKREDVALHLIDAGVEVNYTDGEGESLLHYAADQGSVPVLKALRKRKMLVDFKSKAGETPLMKASFSGKVEAAEYLLAAGAKVDEPRNDGQTPLMTAAYTGNMDLLKLYLAKGADANRVKNGNWSVLHIAAEGGAPEVGAALVKAGAKTEVLNDGDFTPLFMAVIREKYAFAEMLLKHKAEPNPMHIGMTPLAFLGSSDNRSPEAGAFAQRLQEQGGEVKFDKARLEAYQKKLDAKKKQ